MNINVFFGSLSTFLRKGRFIRDFSTLLGGNVVAQLLLLLATPVITRLYPPSEFGTMSLIASYVAVLSVITCLRYDQAIVLPKTKNESNQIVLLTFLISIAVISLVSFFLFVFLKLAVVRTKYDGLLWLIPVGALFTSWKDILVSWNIRNKLFSAIAASQVVMAVASIFIKLVCAIIMQPLAVWLIIGNICGILAGSILLAGFLWKEFHQLLARASISEIYIQAKRYKKFPLYGIMNSFLNSLSQNLPVFLLTYFFSPVIVGYYSLGTAVLRKPIQTIGLSISKVFVQRAAVYNENEKNIEPILKKAIWGLAALAIIPFGVLILFGEKIFGTIFGAEWKTAGFYCQILVPWLFFLFINRPATQVIIVKQDLKFNFYLMVFTILLRGSAMLVGYYLYKSVVVCLILFSAAGVIINAILIRHAFVLCKQNT